MVAQNLLLHHVLIKIHPELPNTNPNMKSSLHLFQTSSVHSSLPKDSSLMKKDITQRLQAAAALGVLGLAANDALETRAAGVGHTAAVAVFGARASLASGGAALARRRCRQNSGAGRGGLGGSAARFGGSRGGAGLARGRGGAGLGRRHGVEDGRSYATCRG